jgi:uncharacterized protein (TIGR03437 family)
LGEWLQLPTAHRGRVPAIHWQPCLAELSPDGSRLLYSSFADGQLLAIDPQDNLYLAGFSPSLGGQAVTRFDPSANQALYRTSLPLRITVVAGAVSDNGAFYVAGFGSSTGFQPSPGIYSHPSFGDDIGVAGIDPSGNLIFSTMIGGVGNDHPTAMTCDGAGNVYLAGIQWPSLQGLVNPYSGPYLDFPVTPDALETTWNPAFLLKLSADGSTLLYGTFLGKSNVEMAGWPSVQPEGLKIGLDGKLRMVTISDQTDIPLTPDSFQPCYPADKQGPSRWTYLQFSADLRAIEYATSMTSLTQGYGPFYFDTSGNVYLSNYVSFPKFYFEVLNVAQRPPQGPACLADYIRQTATPAVPGLLASLLGPGIGPSQAAPTALDASGRVATQLAGTQVLFDGIPAPILSAAPNRIDLVIPFGVPTSGTVTISVLNNGSLVGTLTSPLAAAVPMLFTHDGTGYGAAAWNQDGTPNSASNPAHVGDIITFWATGAGAMTPAVIDGTIPQSPQSAPISPIFLSPIGGSPCTSVYSGEAPGLVEGIIQYNCLANKAIGTFFQFSFEGGTPGFYTLYVK